MTQVGGPATADVTAAVNERFLRLVPLFRSVPDPLMTTIAGAMTTITVPPGHYICREGEIGDRFYLLKAGSLSVSTEIAGREHELARMFVGEFLGEIALLSATERTATVRALEESELLTLDSNQFRRLLGEVPELASIVDLAARQRRSRTLRTSLEVQHRNLAALLEARDEIAIGRAENNDLVFASPNVADHHAKLRRSYGSIDAAPNPYGRIELLDLGSGAGTYVNGQPINKVELQDGDEIVIGDQRFLFDLSKPLTTVEPRGIRIDLVNVRKQVRGSKKTGPKTLLHDLSLSILPGEFVAVVGGSGAGKSTLLDAMAGLRPATAGQVLYNGRDYYQHIEEYRHLLGYVPQDDIIHGDLTVKATLTFAARLRLPRDTPLDSIGQAVTARLQELGLAERADLPVEALSGGQRKRASIALELLTEPRAFFLDEPTSGLDASVDRSMMQLLRNLADGGRTVVLTTHATKNVSLCDKVIILARDGHLAYVGHPVDALRDLGVSAFDEVYDRLEEAQPEEWSTWFRTIQASQDPTSGGVPGAVAAAGGPAPPPGSPEAFHASAPRRGGPKQFLHQLRVLSARNFVLHVSKPENIMPLVMQPVVISLLILALFRTGIWDADSENPTTALQFVYTFDFVMFLFGLLFAAQETVKERSIFLRERTVGVKVVPYLLSKTTFLAPLLVLTAVVMTTLFRLTDRLPDAGFDVYARLVLTLVLTGWAGLSLSLLISSVVNNAQQATDLLTPWIAPQVLFAGALFAVPSMNFVGRALSNITAVRWAFEASARITELKGFFAATRSEIGDALLIQYDASFTFATAAYWAILVAFVVVPLVLATVVLARKGRARVR